MRIEKRGRFYQPDGHLITCKACDCEFRISVEEAVNVGRSYQDDLPLGPPIIYGKCPQCKFVSSANMQEFVPEVPKVDPIITRRSVGGTIDMTVDGIGVVTKILGPVYFDHPNPRKDPAEISDWQYRMLWLRPHEWHCETSIYPALATSKKSGVVFKCSSKNLKSILSGERR